MKDLIEVGVGEIVKHGDESYICVKDDPNSACYCYECAFFNNDHCISMQCASDKRKDRNGVHFVKQRGDNIEGIVADATHKMILAHQAEDALNALLKIKSERILDVITKVVDVCPDDVYISWQPADGWIITDGDWEHVPSQEELIKLLSL